MYIYLLFFAIFLSPTKNCRGVVSLYFIAFIAILYGRAEHDRQAGTRIDFSQILITMKGKQWRKLLCFFLDSFVPVPYTLDSMEVDKVHETKVNCHTFIMNYFFFIPQHGKFAF